MTQNPPASTVEQECVELGLSALLRAAARDLEAEPAAPHRARIHSYSRDTQSNTPWLDPSARSMTVRFIGVGYQIDVRAYGNAMSDARRQEEQPPTPRFTEKEVVSAFMEAIVTHPFSVNTLPDGLSDVGSNLCMAFVGAHDAATLTETELRTFLKVALCAMPQVRAWTHESRTYRYDIADLTERTLGVLIFRRLRQK